MFTIVRKPQIIDNRRSVEEPHPEIINHRDEKQQSQKWTRKMKMEEATYKNLRKHRDELLESEMIYKKTIKELEKEKAEIIQIYEPTYQENKVLKSLLQHGPDAVKIKKLQKDRKELKEEVEKLHDENNKLTEAMSEIMKKHTMARDYVLEKNWHEILTSNKTNKREMKIPQGPFLVEEDKNENKDRSLHENEDLHNQDIYDLELDSVEKEIQIILNNVKFLKKQKRKIDYAVMVGKSAIVKNSALEKAIYDKLDDDLNAFKGNAKRAKKKQEVLKQKLAENEKDLKSREIVANDVHKNEIKYETFGETDEIKSYNTNGTQTDVIAEQKNVSPTFSISHKKSVNKSKNRAVQTESSQLGDVSISNSERNTYLDQYEKKKMQLKEVIRTESKTTSSKKIALEYAKKLTVRKQESKKDIIKNVNAADYSMQRSEDKEHKTKNSYYDSSLKDTSRFSKTKKSNVPSDEYADKLVERKNKIFPYENEIADRVPRGLENSASQGKTAIESKMDSIQRKRNKPVYSNFRDLLSERGNFTKISHKRSRLSDSRIKSRSVGDLNADLKQDYRDKIMLPGIDTLKQVPVDQGRTSVNTSRKEQVKSLRHNSDVKVTGSLTDIAFKRDKVVSSLPAKGRRIKDEHVWKSESDLHAFVENEEDENRPVKEFKCWIPQKDAYVHFRGEFQSDKIQHRDESAYDEVLFDLDRQHKLEGQDVYQEFQKTVKNFKEYKESIRETQKNRIIESGFFPSIVPHAPVKFTTDARNVSGKEILHLMK